jgi:hypothetical protein
MPSADSNGEVRLLVLIFLRRLFPILLLLLLPSHDRGHGPLRGLCLPCTVPPLFPRDHHCPLRRLSLPHTNFPLLTPDGSDSLRRLSLLTIRAHPINHVLLVDLDDPRRSRATTISGARAQGGDIAIARSTTDQGLALDQVAAAACEIVPAAAAVAGLGGEVGDDVTRLGVGDDGLRFRGLGWPGCHGCGGTGGVPKLAGVGDVRLSNRLCLVGRLVEMMRVLMRKS